MLLCWLSPPTNNHVNANRTPHSLPDLSQSSPFSFHSSLFFSFFSKILGFPMWGGECLLLYARPNWGEKPFAKQCVSNNSTQLMATVMGYAQFINVCSYAFHLPFRFINVCSYAFHLPFRIGNFSITRTLHLSGTLWIDLGISACLID